MQSVLLGVIGVILTISVALMGFVFLGDQIRSARYAAEAAELIRRMTAIATAIRVYEDRTGLLFLAAGTMGGVPALVSQGYLRDLPRNPYSGGAEPVFELATRAFGPPVPGARFLVVAHLGHNRRLCEEIARRAGTLPPHGQLMESSRPDLETLPHLDCVRMSASFASDTWMTYDSGGDYLAWLRF